MADASRRKSLSRKSKKSTISRPESDEEPQNCVICLDKVSCRGKLGVCRHWFCFPCIFEWSKNTNTCPVCKVKFRCISKTHLVQGKSPVQKVRVKDVDQRSYQDDEEFIWAELESSQSEDISDYEPSVQDDEEDKTYHINLNMAFDDSDESYFTHSDEDNMSISDSSDTSYGDDTTFLEEMSCSEPSTASESDNSSIGFQKKSARKIVVFDDDEDESSDAETANDWRRKGTEKKSKGKSGAKIGFHRNSHKPQRTSNRKFEAAIQRRTHTTHSKTKHNVKKSTPRKSNNRKTKSASREDCSNSVRQWLSICAQPESSTRSEGFSSRGQWLTTARSGPGSSTRDRNTQSHDVCRELRTRIENSLRDVENSTGNESSSTRNESRSTRNKFSSTGNESNPTRNKPRSTRNESNPTRNESHSTRNESSSTRNEPYSIRNESSSTRNKFSFIRNECSSTRNESRSTRNESSSTRNESSSTRNKFSSTRNKFSSTRNESSSTRNESSSTKNAILPKKRRRRRHRKLTFQFENDSDSYSSDESWTAEPSRLPNVSDSPRRTTRSKNGQKIGRPSKVLREMQNFFDQ